MSYSIPSRYKLCLLLATYVLLYHPTAFAQEEVANNRSTNTYHNQLYFNRYLINPTFSLVRENKSYLNILHRNQYATFDDNSQNYYLGFSHRLNERTALGIGVYSQWEGVIQEFGFNANYASAVRLGEKSALTFGANVTYFNVGLDKNRVVASENDPELLAAGKESKLAIQPGLSLSVGKFDVGLYAQDFAQYNQTTNEITTNINAKSVKGTLQYTYELQGYGLFKNARLMPLLQIGQNQDNSIGYLGSLLLDMPKLGWLQTSWDDSYGLSAGFGFNLNDTMSLGYLMEKDLAQQDANFGWNHELSLAYTFKNKEATSTSYAMGSEDSKIDGIVRNYEEQILKLLAEKEAHKSKTKSKDAAKAAPEDASTNTLAYENRLILDELILRQDSIEAARTAAFEQRFETIFRLLRNDIQNNIKSNLQDIQTGQQTALAVTETKSTTDKSRAQPVQDEFIEVPIKVLNQSDMDGVNTGYYVIANVFKNKSYLNAFMNKLKNEGLEARNFYNKENGLHYVYLADFHFRKDAEVAFQTHLNGRYEAEKWIMQVDNPAATVANSYEDDGYSRRN
ncbi:PorP/SprF family type IX secretion system membrane protein [Arenibacter sp. GZD96]|uniref:PorP/SprF family type IX secretion system membrane protein n=1 Tax=Aurantibrevibacter litoralis TaxID=3106030 RepID=UPI002AFF11FF|nr:PorP/SprF family type IX secretion system membrane protein [Arenibacter sp. GZD-96]MEA1785824.1 PorP/SprF family type IX secretion system membrane protein [Arenibacter sp. GZD-96]